MLSWPSSWANEPLVPLWTRLQRFRYPRRKPCSACCWLSFPSLLHHSHLHLHHLLLHVWIESQFLFASAPLGPLRKTSFESPLKRQICSFPSTCRFRFLCFRLLVYWDANSVQICSVRGRSVGFAWFCLVLLGFSWFSLQSAFLSRSQRRESAAVLLNYANIRSKPRLINE